MKIDLVRFEKEISKGLSIAELNRHRERAERERKIRQSKRPKK